MKTTKLKCTNENIISLFVENYNNLSASNKLVKESLKDKEIRIFTKNDLMIGGYAINTSPPFQYLEALPLDKKSEFVTTYGEDHIEITGIWYQRKNFDVEEHITFYKEMAIDCYKSGKKYTLGGTHILSIKQIHMLCLPRLIHNGIRDFGTVKKEYWVYFGAIEEIIKGVPKLEAAAKERNLKRQKVLGKVKMTGGN